MKTFINFLLFFNLATVVGYWLSMLYIMVHETQFSTFLRKMEFLSGLDVSNFETKPLFLNVIFLTLVFILTLFFKFRTTILPSKKFPPGSFGYPVIGESISFLRAQKLDKTNEWVQERIRKFGPVFKTSLMGSKAVILTGHVANKFMFSGSDNGIASNQVGTVSNLLGKNSLFELSGSKHKVVRSAINSFLKPESLQKYVREMDSLVHQQFSEELDNEETVEMVPLMKKIAFKVTCSLLFGLSEGKEKDVLFEDFTTLSRGLWAMPLNFPGTKYHKALQARKRIFKLLTILTQRKMQEMKEGIVNCTYDIISSLLVFRDEEGEPLSEEEIVDNLLTLMIGSHDTTAILLSLFIRHLIKDVNVYNKVLQEQEEVAKARQGNKGKLTWNEIQMMRYTWRAALETMRLTPPVFGNFKCASRDVCFQGFDIPKGWKVLWVASSTHMDDSIFENPDKFDPIRFEGSTKMFPPYTYMSFGAGPRICPGAEFARIEVLLIVHHLITNYEWTETIPDEPITREPMPYPAMGLPVKLLRRNNNA